MNINRKVRDYQSPLLGKLDKTTGEADCLSFKTFYSRWQEGESLDMRLSKWLDQLKPDVEIVGLETINEQTIIVAFVHRTKAAE